MRYVPAHYHGPTRAESSINLIVLHATLGPETPNSAEGTAAYFASDMGGRAASAHITVDNDSEVCSVPDNVVAYGAKGANANGLHLEQAGRADQTAAQWRDPYSTAVGLRAAAQIARWCTAHPRLRPRFIPAAGLRAGDRCGVTTHAEVSKAWPSTGHTDPGVNYPLAEVLLVASAILGHPSGAPSAPPANVDYADLRRKLAASYAASWRQLGDHDMDHLLTPKGLDVALLQNSLNLATNANLIVDGFYGGATDQAVANFQAWLNWAKPGTITVPPEVLAGVHDVTRFLLVTFLDQIAAGAA